MEHPIKMDDVGVPLFYETPYESQGEALQIAELTHIFNFVNDDFWGQRTSLHGLNKPTSLWLTKRKQMVDFLLPGLDFQQRVIVQSSRYHCHFLQDISHKNMVIYYQPGPGVHILGSEYDIGELPGRFDHLTCRLQADSSVSFLSEMPFLGLMKPSIWLNQNDLTATSQKIDDA